MPHIGRDDSVADLATWERFPRDWGKLVSRLKNNPQNFLANDKENVNKFTEANRGRISRIRSAARRSKQLCLQKRSSTVSRQSVQSVEPSQQLLKELLSAVNGIGSPRNSWLFAGGSIYFGLLLFLGGAVPWALPSFYLLFLLVCLPQRVLAFHARKWTFFLIDFCYFVNVAVAFSLVFTPNNGQVQTMVFALADGPVAGALLVWQCAWVFGIWDHALSVLFHLLPGLAMFAQRYFDAPRGLNEIFQSMKCVGQTALKVRNPSDLYAIAECNRSFPSQLNATNYIQESFMWYFIAPLIFYAVWQFLYWVVVQVVCRDMILRKGYDTSYSTLARRAAKSNNFLNRFVRKGSLARRVVLYGFLQLLFTLLMFIVFIPVYKSFIVGLLWQVIKVVVPLFYGSRYQCERLPKYLLTKALQEVNHRKNSSSIKEGTVVTPLKQLLKENE